MEVTLDEIDSVIQGSNSLDVIKSLYQKEKAFVLLAKEEGNEKEYKYHARMMTAAHECWIQFEQSENDYNLSLISDPIQKLGMELSKKYTLDQLGSIPLTKIKSKLSPKDIQKAVHIASRILRNEEINK